MFSTVKWNVARDHLRTRIVLRPCTNSTAGIQHYNMATITRDTSATELLTKQWHLFLAPALVYVVVWLGKRILLQESLTKIPLAGLDLGNEGKRRAGYMAGAKDIYLEGYRKFKHGVFRVTTPKSAKFYPRACVYMGSLLTTCFFLGTPVIVLDPKFLSELKDLPDDHISFCEAFQEVTTPHIKNLRP